MTQKMKAGTKRTAAPSRPCRESARVEVRNVNVPGLIKRVNAEKYVAMRRALTAVLPTATPGLTQAEMFRSVKRYLPDKLFPGGATTGWWAKTVQLDLEARRLVKREATKPLRWYRTSRS